MINSFPPMQRRNFFLYPLTQDDHVTSSGQWTTATCQKVRPENNLCMEACSLLLLLEVFNHHTNAPKVACWRMQGHMGEKQGAPVNSLPNTIPLSEALLKDPVSS